jgi:hypothetical protein
MLILIVIKMITISIKKIEGTYQIAKRTALLVDLKTDTTNEK